VPLILGVGSILVTFSAYVIDRAMKWYAQVHQVDTEAEQQLAVIKTLEQTANSADPTTAQVAVEKLNEISRRSQESQDKIAQAADTDIVSSVKQFAIWGVVGFIGLELFKASRSK
jgi:hypothetical protein